VGLEAGDGDAAGLDDTGEGPASGVETEAGIGEAGGAAVFSSSC
jgi:hypothetical protein